MTLCEILLFARATFQNHCGATMRLIFVFVIVFFGAFPMNANGQVPDFNSRYNSNQQPYTVSAWSKVKTQKGTAEDVLSLSELLKLIESVEPTAIVVPADGSAAKGPAALPIHKEFSALVGSIVTKKKEALDWKVKIDELEFQRQTQMLEIAIATDLENQSLVRRTNAWSWCICWIAHIVLAIATVAAVVEYFSAYTLRTTSTENTELTIGTDGVSLKTSIHATVILAVALVFYFMYLSYVYPITVIEH